MRRDLSRLADRQFDLLVVGAGIYGAAIAWEAASRGLAVALIDRGDIGGGTSFNNAKTLHGGVRSLQGGRLRELREYVRERRALMRIVPHLVRPLPFVVPTGRSLTRNRLAFGLYFDLYDLLAHDRNEGLDPALRLPASRTLSREACIAAVPAADPSRVTGGIEWHDGQMRSGERVTLAFAASAARAGAVVANYVHAEAWLTHRARIVGARVRDGLSGDVFDVRAALTVNATGPRAGSLLAPLFGRTPPIVPALSLAMNLVVRPVTGRAAAGGLSRGRLFFLAPWGDVTIAGTSHDPYDGTGDVRVTGAHVDRLLSDVNTAFPRARLSRDDVRLVHRGLLPARRIAAEKVQLLKDSVIRHHAADGHPGLMTVVGVRYTTARHTAERAVDLALQALGLGRRPSRTATLPLAGGDIPDLSRFMTAAADRRLAALYGTATDAVLSLAADDPALGEPLAPGCRTIGAEILHAVREEMAIRLGDAVLRRTDAGVRGHPGRPALERAAAIMARELGWDADRCREEIAEVERGYEVP